MIQNKARTTKNSKARTLKLYSKAQTMNIYSKARTTMISNKARSTKIYSSAKNGDFKQNAKKEDLKQIANNEDINQSVNNEDLKQSANNELLINALAVYRQCLFYKYSLVGINKQWQFYQMLNEAWSWWRKPYIPLPQVNLKFNVWLLAYFTISPVNICCGNSLKLSPHQL